MKKNNFRFMTIESGEFALDGGAMFGVVPKVLWEKTNPADALNRIQMALRNLLVQCEDRLILVDTGMGTKWTDKQKHIYKLSYENYSIEKSLKHFGFTVDDITDVLVTHLHFDHIGGALKINTNGQAEPCFPHAKFWIGKENWEWAMHPVEKDKASYLKENFLPLSNSNKLQLIDRFEELQINGLESFKSQGHTTGMLLPIFHGLNETIIFCADLIPTSSHIVPAYVMGYDLRPLESMMEKKIIVEKAYQENWRLFFEHDPFYESAKLTVNEKGQLIGTEYNSVLKKP